MNQKVLFSMLLCWATTNVCTAQYKTTFRYDSSGNMISRVDDYSTEVTSDDYIVSLKRSSSLGDYVLTIYDEFHHNWVGTVSVKIVDVMTSRLCYSRTVSVDPQTGDVALNLRSLPTSIYGLIVEFTSNGKKIRIDKLKFNNKF